MYFNGSWNIGIGFIPNVKIEEVPKLEKRYKIMRLHAKCRVFSLDMMHRTAATQINIDYTSEIDFKKCKVASCLVPIAATLFSNSPFKDSKLNTSYLIGLIFYRIQIKRDRGYYLSLKTILLKILRFCIGCTNVFYTKKERNN